MPAHPLTPLPRLVETTLRTYRQRLGPFWAVMAVRVGAQLAAAFLTLLGLHVLLLAGPVAPEEEAAWLADPAGVLVASLPALGAAARAILFLGVFAAVLAELWCWGALGAAAVHPDRPFRRLAADGLRRLPALAWILLWPSVALMAATTATAGFVVSLDCSDAQAAAALIPLGVFAAWLALRTVFSPFYLWTEGLTGGEALRAGRALLRGRRKAVVERLLALGVLGALAALASAAVFAPWNGSPLLAGQLFGFFALPFAAAYLHHLFEELKSSRP